MTDPVTTDEAKQNRIRDKIAASQARLRGELPPERMVAPPRRNLPDDYPPENYRSLAAEYPLLTVVGGLALGALAGSLLPKTAGGKLGKRALSALAVAAEIGLTLSKNAAQKARHDGLVRLEGSATELRKGTRRAIGSARSSGGDLVRAATKLAIRKIR